MSLTSDKRQPSRHNGITKTRPCSILQFFTAVKKFNFQMKKCEVFLIFAYTLIVGTR